MDIWGTQIIFVYTYRLHSFWNFVCRRQKQIGDNGVWEDIQFLIFIEPIQFIFYVIYTSMNIIEEIA